MKSFLDVFLGMGQAQSVDPNHLRIWTKLIQIRDPATRAQTIETIFAGQEYVYSAKRLGIYSNCLAYVSAVRQGRNPGLLPGEVVQQRQIINYGHQSQQGHSQQGQQNVVVRNSVNKNPIQYLAKPRSSEKALNFFTACLRVLGIQEEVALTEERLRKAYRAAAIKAHPDKGGSEEQFQAITKAYAYLNDILRLVQGQNKTSQVNEALPDVKRVQETRARQTTELSHVEPVRLNPKNLNLTAFNQMFEQTRIPDPDEDGYGDWLTTGDATNSLKEKKKFGKDFNREVFNRMFEDDQRTHGQSQSLTIQQPQALILSTTSGVELGRDRPPDYTAPYSANLKYTDLKQAYTKENTISGQVSGIRAESRDFESYRASREKAPSVYSEEEQEALNQFERQQAVREEQRRLRAAQEMMSASDYHERMKRLVLTG